MVLPKEKIPDPVQPSLETLYSAGRTVAELHFKRIVTHGEGVLGGGTDAQHSEEGSRQSVMCAHVEVDDAQESAQRPAIDRAAFDEAVRQLISTTKAQALSPGSTSRLQAFTDAYIALDALVAPFLKPEGA